MRTFHCWRSKRERERMNIITKSDEPMGHHQPQHFIASRVNKHAHRCVKTTAANVEVEAVRETLLL